MRKISVHFIIIVLFFAFQNNLFSQDGGNKIINLNNKSAIDASLLSEKIVDVSHLSKLDEDLKIAIQSGNLNLENELRAQINNLTKENTIKPESLDRDYPSEDIFGVTQNPDWITNDILIYSGDIGQTSTDHRRIDIKMGEDGNLYSAVIRRPETGANGRIDVFKSSDGGGSWLYVTSSTSATAYFGQVSLEVAMRSASNLDSTRIFLFYSRSVNTDFSGATINYASFLRDGTGWKGGVPVLTPPSGSKLLYPSAVSDGQYWSTATYIGVTCGEYDVDSTKMKNLHFARTTNWGDTYTTSVLNDGYPTWGDWFPNASFKDDATDSIYIAVERRFSSSPSQTRVIATPWSPSSGFKRYMLADSVSLQYQKPDVTIVQDAGSLPKRIVVASIRDGVGIYSYSTNGGSSWLGESYLSLQSENNLSFLDLNSDSTKDGGGYVVSMYQKSAGDSIVVRRGIPGSLGTRVNQPNEFQSSIFNSPKVAIYNPSGIKSSVLLYTGLVSNYTSNLYFDGETVVTDVTPENSTPESYSLQQNYPNPFNPNTKINFSIPEQTIVKLKIFNAIGQEIATILNTELAAGNHTVDFNAASLSSGVYLYRVETPNFTSTKKMILMK
jgi:hypothetical protein